MAKMLEGLIIDIGLPFKCDFCMLVNLGATSIVKIGEVRLSDEIGGVRDF